MGIGPGLQDRPSTPGKPVVPWVNPLERSANPQRRGEPQRYPGSEREDPNLRPPVPEDGFSPWEYSCGFSDQDQPPREKPGLHAKNSNDRGTRDAWCRTKPLMPWSSGSRSNPETGSNRGRTSGPGALPFVRIPDLSDHVPRRSRGRVIQTRKPRVPRCLPAPTPGFRRIPARGWRQEQGPCGRPGRPTGVLKGRTMPMPMPDFVEPERRGLARPEPVGRGPRGSEKPRPVVLRGSRGRRRARLAPGWPSLSAVAASS